MVGLAGEAIQELSPMRGGQLWANTLGRTSPLDASFLLDSEDPTTFMVVGCIDEVVVGYGVVRLQAMTDGQNLGVISDLFTHPDARGVGIGELMMKLVVEWCQERGCIGVDAVALPGNRETKNFFETFGLKARAIIVHRSLTSDADEPRTAEGDAHITM